MKLEVLNLLMLNLNNPYNSYFLKCHQKNGDIFYLKFPCLKNKYYICIVKLNKTKTL